MLRELCRNIGGRHSTESLDKNGNLICSILNNFRSENGNRPHIPIKLLMTATNKEASTFIRCDEAWDNWEEINSPSDYDRISYCTFLVVC